MTELLKSPPQARVTTTDGISPPQEPGLWMRPGSDYRNFTEIGAETPSAGAKALILLVTPTGLEPVFSP